VRGAGVNENRKTHLQRAPSAGNNERKLVKNISDFFLDLNLIGGRRWGETIVAPFQLTQCVSQRVLKVIVGWEEFGLERVNGRIRLY